MLVNVAVPAGSILMCSESVCWLQSSSTCEVSRGWWCAVKVRIGWLWWDHYSTGL